MTMNRVYGVSQEVYIVRKGGGDTFVMGGTTQAGSRWTRVLSKRATYMLWFHLARYLFPQDADDVTSNLPTAALRGLDLPTITQHVVIQSLETGSIEIIGYTSAGTWTVQLNSNEIQHFWTTLDQAMSA